MTNNFTNQKYIRICKDSGCFSASYHSTTEDDDNVIISQDTNDKSGKIKVKPKKS